MQMLAQQMKGQWQDGWDHRAGSYSLLDGNVKSRTTWKQISSSDKEIAVRILQTVQEESANRKTLSRTTHEDPMPIEVKLVRREVSFRHPESQRWVRGKRLGDAFTLEKLGIAPPARTVGHRHRSPDISR